MIANLLRWLHYWGMFGEGLVGVLSLGKIKTHWSVKTAAYYARYLVRLRMRTGRR